MTQKPDGRTPFFIGYLTMPKALAVFLAIVVGAVMGLGGAVATRR